MSYEHFCSAYLKPLDNVYIELDRYGVLIYHIGIQQAEELDLLIPEFAQAKLIMLQLESHQSNLDE